MQSFLGSLNYYSRFIEDFAIYAAVLYELRKADFHEISRTHDVSTLNPESGDDHDHATEIGTDHDRTLEIKGDHDREGRNRWKKAAIAFTLLKSKIAATPILKHFDPDRPPVIVVYASK